jgi:hypothetical protein
MALTAQQQTGGSATLTKESTETVQYVVTSTEYIMVLMEAIRAPGIPRRGDKHPTDPIMVVDQISASYNGDPKVATVTVRYAVPTSTGGSSGSGGGDETSPLAEPPEVAWSTSAYDRTVATDIEDKIIANSAGIPFDPGVATVAYYRPVLTVSNNRRTFAKNTLLLQVGTRNSKSVTIFGQRIPAEYGLLVDYSGQLINTGTLSYWRCTMQIAVDLGMDGSPKKWRLRLADTGFKDINGKYPPDEFGIQSGEPANLTDGAFSAKADKLDFDIIPATKWDINGGIL